MLEHHADTKFLALFMQQISTLICSKPLQTYVDMVCIAIIKYHFWNLIFTSCRTLANHCYTLCRTTLINPCVLQILNTSIPQCTTPHHHTAYHSAQHTYENLLRKLNLHTVLHPVNIKIITLFMH